MCQQKRRLQKHPETAVSQFDQCGNDVFPPAVTSRFGRSARCASSGVAVYYTQFFLLLLFKTDDDDDDEKKKEKEKERKNEDVATTRTRLLTQLTALCFYGDSKQQQCN